MPYKSWQVLDARKSLFCVTFMPAHFSCPLGVAKALLRFQGGQCLCLSHSSGTSSYALCNSSAEETAAVFHTAFIPLNILHLLKNAFFFPPVLRRTRAALVQLVPYGASVLSLPLAGIPIRKVSFQEFIPCLLDDLILTLNARRPAVT